MKKPAFRKALSSSLIVIAGLLVSPGQIHPDQHRSIAVSRQDDPRLARLRSYFREKNCPIEDLSADFIAAADAHNLDWRLLPAISIIESSGGKRYIRNNIFGWDSCKRGFPTIRDGIHHVAARLANSSLYKNKDVDGILKTYNPYSFYPGRVKRVMRALGPANLAFNVARN